MSKHPEPGSDPQAPTPEQVPTPEQARQMLADARQIERRTTDAVPAPLITYAILCVLGTMATLAIHLAARVVPDPSFNAPLVVIVASMAWVFVAILVPFLFRRPFRRGLAVRWVVYMVIWAVLWAAGMFFGVETGGLFIAPAFLVVFMIAVTTEAKHAKAVRAAEAGQAPTADGSTTTGGKAAGGTAAGGSTAGGAR